jgi:hypothetical protein
VPLRDWLAFLSFVYRILNRKQISIRYKTSHDISYRYRQGRIAARVLYELQATDLFIGMEFENHFESSDAPSALVQHMLHNEPAVVAVGSKDWDIAQCCICNDGTLNISKFKEIYGACVIPVDTENSSYSAARTSMNIADLLDRMIAGERVYGKDWHFLLQQSTSSGDETMQHALDEQHSIFTLPAAVTEDWLNWYSDILGKDDYRFMYLGGKGSRTGLHYDVLCSYSWSVNIAGRKLWRFWSPEQFGEVEVSDESVNTEDTAPVLEFVQEANQLVFVPSGWYHTVDNLGVSDSDPAAGQITLSINHNWMNGFNIYRVWRFILQELRNVQQEMLCFRRPPHSNDITLMVDLEWNIHNEKMMRANCSFSVLNFFEMLSGRLLYALFQQWRAVGSEPDVTPFVLPPWAPVLCNTLCERILSATSDGTWYKTSLQTCVSSYCSVPISVPAEAGKESGKASDLLPCPSLNREEFFLTIPNERNPSRLLSKVSIPAFGVIETCRILQECAECPGLLTHLSVNLTPQEPTSTTTTTTTTSAISATTTINVDLPSREVLSDAAPSPGVEGVGVDGVRQLLADMTASAWHWMHIAYTTPATVI